MASHVPSLPCKTVLVCLGERKREVRFKAEGASDLEELLKSISEVFEDVFTQERISASQLIISVKNEDWNGEFLDATGDIPDKSVVKAIVSQHFDAGVRSIGKVR